MTSLYFHVVRVERLKADAVIKLNNILGLAHREDALKFPVLIRELVWNGTEIDQVLSEELLDRDISEAHAREISKRVVSLAHRRFRFGTTEDMVSAVSNLILNGSRLAQAA